MRTNPYRRSTTCSLCRRDVQDLTRHHLVPRTRYRKAKRRKAAMNPHAGDEVVFLCSSCHRFVHAVLSEKELEQQYNTLERLLAHPDIDNFVKWIYTRPPGKRFRIRRKR